jgi:glutamate racemase
VKADILLLGCTHYPLIKPLLRRVAPEHIAIVDSDESTAQEVLRKLGSHRTSDPATSAKRDESKLAAQLKFFATDSAEKFIGMGTRFLGLPVEDVTHVDLKE